MKNISKILLVLLMLTGIAGLNSCKDDNNNDDDDNAPVNTPPVALFTINPEGGTLETDFHSMLLQAATMKVQQTLLW